MEFAIDNLVARVLLTLNTLGYSLVPVLADFNSTHATNPLWTPHARFHVVWQVLSYCGIGSIALFLIWTAGPAAKLWMRRVMVISSPDGGRGYRCSPIEFPPAARRAARRRG